MHLALTPRLQNTQPSGRSGKPSPHDSEPSRHSGALADWPPCSGPILSQHWPGASKRLMNLCRRYIQVARVPKLIQGSIYMDIYCNIFIFMAIYWYLWPYMDIYVAIYAHIHSQICTLGVWTCILSVWTCILRVWTCIGCLNLYLGVLTCIWVSELVFGCKLHLIVNLT